MTDAVARYGDALKFASPKVKDKNGKMVDPSPNLKNNEKIVTIAVKQSDCALMYVHDEMKNNKQVVIAAVTQDGHALKYASDELRRNWSQQTAAEAHNTTSRASEYHASSSTNQSNVPLEIVTKAVNQDDEEIPQLVTPSPI